MSARAYWIVFVIILGLAVWGFISANPPQREDVELQILIDFFRDQHIAGVVIGAIIGLLGGWLAIGGVKHRPGDRGADYDSRVGWRGLATGLVAVLVAGLFTLVSASVVSMQPLAPVEKVLVVMQTILFFVVLALALVTAMATFAIVSRMPNWGGKYALIRRF